MITYSEILMSLEMGLLYGLASLGVYLTFRIIAFSDITCDASFSLGGAISGALIVRGWDPYFALFAAMCMGALAGVGTGILHTRLKIIDVLCGILIGFMLYSINLRIMGGIPNIALMSFDTIFKGTSPLIVLSLVVLSALFVFSYLFSTDFGLALRSIGQNKILATNSGVNVSKMIIFGLALSNAIIALSGALLSQHQGFSDSGSGAGTLIIGLTSVTIGEKIFACRSVVIQLMSCVIGSVLYRLLIGIALYSDIIGLQTQDLNLFTGLLILWIMSLRRRSSC